MTAVAFHILLTGMKEYIDMQENLSSGWNTWNTRSFLSWVHLPEAFAVNLGIKSYVQGTHLRETLMYREEVSVGGHAGDGSYSECTVTFGKTKVRIETTVDGDDLLVYADPQCDAIRKSLLVVEVGVLWNRDGYVVREGERLIGHCGETHFSVHTTCPSAQDPHIIAMTPYLGLPLSGLVAVCTGKSRSLKEIETAIADRRKAYIEERGDYGEYADIYEAIRTAVNWNTIYEPTKDRVFSPVNRNWSTGAGGYVLCLWDNFLVSMLAAVDNRALAYANAVEMLNVTGEGGFVAQCAMGSGRVSADRSMLPVGGITIRALYEKFRDRWFLEETFDLLLTWNRWWTKNRFLDGYMCWGSNPFEPFIGLDGEHTQPNSLQGARYESCLDNSPMYDDVQFDPDLHLMLLADVGLMGMYAADCDALAAMAAELGRSMEETELRTRYEEIAAKLQTLWHEDTGMFLNKRLDTGEYSFRLSPTHFYPLIGGVATPAQARRMIDEHFFNEEEFWGEWVLPSIARNDPAYPEGYYWRGRVWAPMNWLVYQGLKRYDLPKARSALAERSAALLLKEWREHHHVHENYSSVDGTGCGSRSHPLYHWGGLLGLIALKEHDLA